MSKEDQWLANAQAQDAEISASEIAFFEVIAMAKAIFGVDPCAPDAMSWEQVDQSVRDYYLRLAEAAQNARSHGQSEAGK